MKKRLLFTSLIAFSLWLCYAAYRDFTDIESGELLASVDWLPKEATNVSFYRSYFATAYGFAISEHGFRDWSGNKRIFSYFCRTSFCRSA